MSDCTLKFPGTLAAFGRASGELRRALESHGVAERTRYNVELVFEEIVSNVIRHGCSHHVQCAIEVEVDIAEDAVVLSFQDNGQPFDPSEYTLPDTPRSLEAASRGGLGLLLVRNAAARIEYELTRHNKNRVTVTIAGA